MYIRLYIHFDTITQTWVATVAIKEPDYKGSSYLYLEECRSRDISLAKWLAIHVALEVSNVFHLHVHIEWLPTPQSLRRHENEPFIEDSYRIQEV